MQGEFVHGKREGFGKFVYADGAVYEGQWIDDRIHGEGVAIFASGNRYEGGVLKIIDMSACGNVSFFFQYEWILVNSLCVFLFSIIIRPMGKRAHQRSW